MNPNAPTIIVSSSPRAGSTLVQRLLCSSSNTIIYGDPVGQEIEFLVTYAETKKHFYAQNAARIDPLRKAVLAGDDLRFIASMMPERHKVERALESVVGKWIDACSQDASEAGREFWGWKVAGGNPFVIGLLPQWFPEARIITLTRDLADVVKSAKADGHFRCEDGLKHFCESWISGEEAINALRATRGDRVLALDFSDMIHNQMDTIRRLEEFTGARDILADVFLRKINHPDSDVHIPPADLTDWEQGVVDRFLHPPATKVA